VRLKGFAGILAVFGVFVTAFLAVLAYFSYVVAHSQDAGEPERVASKIVNFTVPKGFRLSQGLDLPVMKQATLVSLDSRKPMTILLQGIYYPGVSEEAMNQNQAAMMQSRCAAQTKLSDEMITANGALLTMHRLLCVGAEGGKEVYEYEFGSFVGKAPLVTAAAFAPKASWDPAPFHALLRSLH
jgi:hypothetical protein